MDRKLLRENRIHGDNMFPCGVYDENYISGHNFLDCHWHDEMEFLLVTEGCGVFQVDASYYKVSAGEAIFVNSGKLHAGYPQDDSSCAYTAIVFSPGLLMGNSYDALQVKFLDPLFKNRYRMPVHFKQESGWEKELLMHIGTIIDMGLHKPFTYELQIKAHLYLAFSLLFSESSLLAVEKKIPANEYKTGKLKEVIKYIQDNYNKRMTINELALQMNMSDGHFCRYFKQMLRRTPVDYVNYYRVNMAAKLLGDSRKKIIEVAMDVGFDNCSYFIYIFKNYMKCTPSEYRRNNCSSGEDAGIGHL